MWGFLVWLAILVLAHLVSMMANKMGSDLYLVSVPFSFVWLVAGPWVMLYRRYKRRQLLRGLEDMKAAARRQIQGLGKGPGG